MHSLTVNLQTTSAVDLNDFLKNLGEGDKLRGKKLKDGNYLLYTSTKTKGTGLKNRLFKTVDHRRQIAASIVGVIGMRAELNGPAHEFGMTYVPINGKELTAQQAQEAVVRTKNVILSSLPEGVLLDAQGNLTGTSQLIKTPTYREGETSAFGARTGLNYEDYFNQASLDILARPFVSVGDQQIVSQSTHDFWRMDYEFTSSDGEVFSSRQIESTDQEDRNIAVTRALHALTGDEKATIVLSSVLNQDLTGAIGRGLSGPDGRALTHLRVISATNTAGREVSLFQKDGSRQRIDNAAGMGKAKFKLCRDGEDFKLTLDWEAYYETKPGLENSLPLGKNDVIGIHYQAEFNIDGNKARDGKMALTIPGGIQMAFSGRLDFRT